MASVTTKRIIRRDRAFVRIKGPDARDFLQRMLSNDVEALEVGEACNALLLTPKARIIAPLRVLRRDEDDFLLSTEPELGDRLRNELLRMRFAAKADIEPEEHHAWFVLGGDEVFDERPQGVGIDTETFERWRIENVVPAWGRELDENILPAEAGLTETHVSFTKGCYPGQEPIARQHYRGKVNRRLRVIETDGDVEPGSEIVLGDRTVGRVTSAASGLALAFVRTDIPEAAELRVGSHAVRLR